MQSSSWVDSVDNIRKQRDDLLVRVSNLEINVDRLMKENATLGERNIHLQTLADSGTISYQNLAAMHKDATETFARTIASMASGQGSSKKRSRSDSQNEEEEEAETKRREEGIDRYANGLLALRDAAHAKKIEELKEVHKREISKLRARVDEPVNEFRVSKQFHIKEAALRGEIQSLQGQLESEKTKSKSMEFAQVERMDEMRTSKELKQRTIERDRLAVEVQGMKAEMERMREPYRSMGNQELLGIIDVLKEKHATVVIGMVDGVDAMKKERDDAVKKLAAAVQEANVFRECLEGKYGGSASKSAASKSKLCAPCNKLHNVKIDLIKKKHAEEMAKLQHAVKQWTVKYDAKLEAHSFSHRFRDRENELKQRVEVLEQELCKVKVELREKRANFDTHMVSTLKHKAIAREVVAVKEQFELARARVAELEKSVLQDSVVADLSKKHHAQMLRAKRVHAISREKATQLAAELDAEQLRVRMGTLFEEDLLFAYRSLRAEYNRDVGRVPVTRRPRREGGEDNWLDGVSEGEPEVE